MNYFYDGEGKRVRTTTATGGATIYVYDAAGQLSAEYSVAEMASLQAPRVSYMTSDHLGSPRIVTDANGAVVSRKDFAAFGDETLTSQRTPALGYNAPDIRQDYTGYLKDNETGLEYAQARYYNQKHGRFTSVDPLGASASIRNPQTLNRYSYALNSPYKFTDPLGLVSAAANGRYFGCPADQNHCEEEFFEGSTIRVGSWDELSKEQQRLFTSYYENQFGAGTDSCGHSTTEALAEAYWNASVTAANNGDEKPKNGLSQDQLTTFVGVTDMWESTGVSSKVAKVTEIRGDVEVDSFSLRGTFAAGGKAYIQQQWHYNTIGGISWRQKDKDSPAPNGQFKHLSDMDDSFQSDVDYHRMTFLKIIPNRKHRKHKNSDIREPENLATHSKAGEGYGDVAVWLVPGK